jgi:nitrogen fixation NifU-like protein
MSDAHDHSHDSPLVLDHFLNPRNVGDRPDADGVGEVGAVACGDVMRISIKVRDGQVVDARFRTFGCGTAIAASSVVTELVKGRTLEELKKLSGSEVSAALGGLPAAKAHCPVLAEEAVKAAVEDYLRRAGRKT